MALDFVAGCIGGKIIYRKLKKNSLNFAITSFFDIIIATNMFDLANFELDVYLVA